MATDDSAGSRLSDAQAIAVNPPDFAPPRDQPLRIFLVEDSNSVRDRLTELLNVPGEYEVVGHAENEAESVAELLRRPVVDVAIVDLNLRKGSGLGVIASVRARYPHSPPLIVVLTNYAFPEYEVASRARGADFFFDKSTQFGAVKALLAEMRARRLS